MPFSQIATSVTIINSGLIGYTGISLTNYSTSTLSAIASGSSIEIAGAFFKASEDITINASSWSAITTGTTAYISLTPSGTAGTQILTAAYTQTVPVWSTSKQGWYTSAGSNIRVVASVFKVSSTQKAFPAINEFPELSNGDSPGLHIGLGKLFLLGSNYVGMSRQIYNGTAPSNISTISAITSANIPANSVAMLVHIREIIYPSTSASVFYSAWCALSNRPLDTNSGPQYGHASLFIEGHTGVGNHASNSAELIVPLTADGNFYIDANNLASNIATASTIISIYARGYFLGES